MGIAFLAEAHWPYRYRVIKPMLEEVLGGHVTIAHYHRTYFPNPGFMATGITLDRNPTPGRSPVGNGKQRICSRAPGSIYSCSAKGCARWI